MSDLVPLYEELMPSFDLSDELAVAVNARAADTWLALLDTDLIEVGSQHKMTGVLGAVRMLPGLVAGLVHGDTPQPMPDSMKLGELGAHVATGGDWAKLGERIGSELAFGLVGKFWKPVIEYEPVAAPDFFEFDRQGFAKTIYAFRIVPTGETTCNLIAVMRTKAYGDDAQRWFRRYWTYGVGSGAHVLVNSVIESARDAAEAA